MYANANHDRIPLGYWSAQKQTNFMINVNDNGASFRAAAGRP